MKKVLLIVGLLCVLCPTAFCANDTEEDVLLINSSNKTSEIPIELNSIQYKEFTPDINDMDDISIREDFKPLNLLSNKFKSSKTSLLSYSEIRYKQKEKDSMIPRRWEIVTKIY